MLRTCLSYLQDESSNWPSKQPPPVGLIKYGTPFRPQHLEALQKANGGDSLPHDIQSQLNQLFNPNEPRYFLNWLRLRRSIDLGEDLKDPPPECTEMDAYINKLNILLRFESVNEQDE
jgi:hypothetical protein